MRLDKYLAHMGMGTRTEVKQHIKKGRVTVNGVQIKAAQTKIDVEHDDVVCDGRAIAYVKHVYLMLNKPQGVITATHDAQHRTVLDLIDDYTFLDLFPVGRLDKDTEGLLFITNDGNFNHHLMSPQHHVKKVYEVTCKAPITEQNVMDFKQGVMLSDGITKPAQLTYIDAAHAHVTLYEGRYHQVKRMFHAIENEVLHLKRIQIGDVPLDAQLSEGEYRELTEAELSRLNVQSKA